MAKNIERRGNTWYATLHVPKDVQITLGKTKFFQTLKTTDKRLAESRAAPLVALWKAEIAAARGQTDPYLEALQLRRDYESEGENQDVLRDHIEAVAEQFGKGKSSQAASDFYAIATGLQSPLQPHFTEWAMHLKLAPKTIDQMKKDVSGMIKHFVMVERVTNSSVRDWVKALMEDTPTKKGYSQSSIKRIIGFCRNFWGFLQETEKADIDKQPFAVPTFAKKKKGASVRGGWVPFAPLEVVGLLNAARNADDRELADLICLGMYTGARIEELCALKTEHCTDEAFEIIDSKTKAGIRLIPVHSALIALVGTLKAGSKDGYLLSGLTFNKYGDRSNAIGKRFGRLKQALGHQEKKVFHSIRKTVVTLLEDAGISENLAAELVGHEKPRITYGLYSDGHRLATMKEAIELVTYPHHLQSS